MKDETETTDIRYFCAIRSPLIAEIISFEEAVSIVNRTACYLREKRCVAYITSVNNCVHCFPCSRNICFITRIVRVHDLNVILSIIDTFISFNGDNSVYCVMVYCFFDPTINSNSNPWMKSKRFVLLSSVRPKFWKAFSTILKI